MNIRIREYTFTLSEPFAAGHIISANEAVALNALRAENIRNAMAQVVATAISDLPQGGILEPDRLRDLTHRIAAFDRDYQFPSRHVKPRVGRLDQRIRQHAIDAAMAEFRSNHYSPSQNELDARVVELIKSNAIIDLARREVEEKNRLAGVALETLL